MALNTALRGIVGEDVILVSDILHGDKPSLNITFRNITSSLSGRPISGADASDHQRGDYWTDGTSYMVVINPVEQIWASPVNDSIQGGGGGGVTPQQLAAVRSRLPYSIYVAFHETENASVPTVTNIVPRADGFSTFNLSGGWVNQPTTDSTRFVIIGIRAAAEGDTTATSIVSPVYPLLRGADGSDADARAYTDQQITNRVKAYARDSGRLIESADIKLGEVKTENIGGGAVTADRLADNSVTGRAIADDNVELSHLADSATNLMLDPNATNGQVMQFTNGSWQRVTLATSANVKPFADSDQNVLIQGTDIGDNTIGSDQLANRSVGTDELQTNSVTEVKIPDNEIPEGKFVQPIRDKLSRVLPTGGNPGDVITRGQGSLFSWAAPTGGGGSDNVATWAQTNNADLIPDTGSGNKISNRIVRRTEMEEEIGTLEGLIEAGATSRQLRLFDHDMRIIQHPGGVWEPTADASIATSAPAAFLFENSTVEPNSVPIEPGTASGYSFASRGTTNFVRIHQNPNSDANAFHGVTPYTSGLNNITTPANQKRKLITGLWSQGFAARADNDTNDDTSTFLGFGSKRLIRFNQRGIDVSIGSSTPTNRDVTHFVGLTTITLQRHTRFGPVSVTLPANANGTKLRLSSRRYVADSTIPQSTGSVEVNNLSTSLTNFSIPVQGQAPITGTVQYNPSNRAMSFIFTGGFNITNERFEVHIDNEVRERINYPATPQFAGILAADQPENDDVFRQGDKQEFVFAIEKQFDEPDADNNIMKLVYRIDNHTGEVNLRQTRAELMLDGTMTHIVSSLQYLSHLQLGTYTGNMTRAITENIEVETIGWGQVVKNSIDDDITLRAGLYADKLGFRNSDGTIRDLAEAYSWAQVGNPDVLPEAKIPASMRVPGQTLEDVIINVTNPTTVEADAQRIAFGQHDLREQNGSKLKWIAFPVQWKEGATAGEASDNNNRPIVQQILIDIDQLPTDALIPNQGDEWERIYTVRQYPGSYQKLVIRVWQRRTATGAAGGAGVGSIWLGLYYRNFGNGHNYVSPTNNPPGDVPAAGITHFAFFHFGGGNTQNNNTDAERLKQIRLVPKAQKGDPGDDGPTGPQGPAGAPSTVAGPAGKDSTVPGPKGDDGEPGQGVATGGTAGQVLSKIDATDFNTRWTDSPEPGLNQAAVDERVKAGVKDFAETDSSTKIASGDTDFATRLLPSNPGNNQIAQWNGTAWVAINTPSGGGGGTVSGTSGWGTNLLSSQLRTSGTTAERTGTINLSGEIDSILVVAGAVTSTLEHRASVEIISPLTAAESHQILIENTDAGSGFSFENLDFSFPVATGANAQIRLDQTRLGVGRIIGVYKKTRISGSAPSSGGLNQAAVDERVKAGVQDFAEANNTALVPDNKLPRMSSRIGFSVSGISPASVSDPSVGSDVRARNTEVIITCGTVGAYHKLTFTKFGTEAWATVDSNGNIRFAAGDYRNIIFRCDFSVASITTPSGGNDRIEVGMAIVTLNANGTRTFRKNAVGQYMRNTTQNPAFRTANILIERTLTLPDPFVAETWEVYLYCEATNAGRQIRINSEWSDAANARIDGVGGGAYLIGHRL